MNTEHLRYPNPQIFDHHKAVFVHVPKCGGTSIEQTLRAKTQVCGGHTTAQAYRKHFQDQWNAYFSFGFVREPVSRFLSGYQYLRQQPIHPALGNQTVHDCHLLGFMDAVEADTSILRRIVHLTPQTAFLCDETGAVMVDKIYPFEDMERAWLDICHVLGCYHPLPKMNVSKPLSLTPVEKGRVKAVVGRLYEEDYGVFAEYFGAQPVSTAT